MDGTRFLVWVDRDHARIIELIDGATRAIRLETDGYTDGSSADDLARMYLFDEIADTVVAGVEVVLTGPGPERFDLRDYLAYHRPSVSSCVIGVENIGHASDTMLRTYARTYFRLSDRR